jgi:cob(I)alamin adenosyltransferase
MNEGLIHVYFGDGKGKTTAAVGLAARAAGRGRRVVFEQFLKGRKTGELNSLKKADVKIIRSEKNKKFCWDMTDEEIVECRQIQAELFDEILEAVQPGGVSPAQGQEQTDLLVLDEALNAIGIGVLDEEKLRDFITKKPDGLELVLTGQKAPEWLIEKADYITEMKKHKHPFDKGIDGREAIEF